MLKVIELFAGVGSQTQALKNLNIPHEVVAISEIDKYAINTYKQLHGEVNNLGDISEITRLPKADLWTYSFPCQDLSIAGKLEGIKKGTRSGLLLEVERLLDVAAFMGELPKYLLLENVKNLVGKRFKPDFDNWLQKLETLGYTNYWQVLNAKDYGIPQNRERVFCVSILGNEYFEFPQKQELKLRLKDMLEDEVDEKYYLSDANFKHYNRNFGSKGKLQDEICDTLQAAMGTGGGNIPIIENNKCIQVGNLEGGKWDKINESCRRVYSEEGLSPTIHTCQGGNTEPKVAQNEKKILYEKPLERKGWHHKACEVLNTNGITTCIHTQSNNLLQKIKEDSSCRIRKLIPKECWRLMGWNDEQFNKITGISNTQLYKMAGNSIVVQVLEAIFRNLFLEEQQKAQIDIFDYINVSNSK